MTVQNHIRGDTGSPSGLTVSGLQGNGTAAGAKKILVVSSSFYPMNTPRSFRTTELVKEFARMGHDVTLLTLKDETFHAAIEKEFGITIKDLGPLRFRGVPIDGRKRWVVWLQRAVRRGLLQLFEYPDIELMFRVRKALESVSGYDLMITIAVPHTIHWGAARAWREHDPIASVWVADCGDPYMGQTLDSFKKMFYFKYLEKEFCRKADYISVPLEAAKQGYYPEFREKIRVIPQGYKFEEADIDRSTYKKNKVPTFAYAGGLIPGGRDPGALLEYLTGLDRDYRFILYTRDTELVDPWLEKGDNRIEIRDYIPRNDLLKILGTMDFLVNIENESELMMPSKLIDYYFAGRPVLNVSGRGIVPEELDRFLDGDYRNGLKFEGIERYRIENVCRRFIDLYNHTWNEDEVPRY